MWALYLYQDLKIIKRHLVGILRKLSMDKVSDDSKELFLIMFYVMIVMWLDKKKLNDWKKMLLNHGDKMTQYLKFTLKYNKRGKRNR